MSDPETQRTAIRDAMTRLLDGAPIRSDGKLTIKTLADEAGVTRWVLTHRHTGLPHDSRTRVLGFSGHFLGFVVEVEDLLWGVVPQP